MCQSKIVLDMKRASVCCHYFQRNFTLCALLSLGVRGSSFAALVAQTYATYTKQRTPKTRALVSSLGVSQFIGAVVVSTQVPCLF